MSPGWDEYVMYELYLGTFNPDANGHGTIVSAQAKLDDLTALGITAIEIMPIAQFDTTTSWGYNSGYAYAFESAYGTIAEFEAFVDAAHASGIAVIIDLVFNHSGPSDFWQFDGWNQDGQGGIYFYEDWRKDTPLGGAADMLLQERRVDGVRLNATHYIRNAGGSNDDPASDLADGAALLRDLASQIDGTQPWKMIVAEDVGVND